jgi:hypothetical protein
MRRTIELLVNRVVRSRWGIALLIAVIVLGIVGVGRAFSGGEDRAPLLDAPTAAPTISIDPADDDGITSAEPPPAPTTSPGTAEPEAVAYAFASAWVDHQDVSAAKWHSGLLPHATEALADKLKGVDPEGVPAARIVGRPELVPIGEGLVDAVVTVDTGKVRLRLVAPDGHWLVDGVDWEAA